MDCKRKSNARRKTSGACGYVIGFPLLSFLKDRPQGSLGFFDGDVVVDQCAYLEQNQHGKMKRYVGLFHSRYQERHHSDGTSQDHGGRQERAEHPAKQRGAENDSQKSLVIPFLLYNALDSDGICMIVSCFGTAQKQEGKTVFFGMAQNHAITEIPYIPCL